MIEPEKKNRIEIFTVRREFTKFYLQKYIKNSGFHSVTQCLLGFENLKDQLRSNAVLNTNSKSNTFTFSKNIFYNEKYIEMKLVNSI